MKKPTIFKESSIINIEINVADNINRKVYFSRKNVGPKNGV